MKSITLNVNDEKEENLLLAFAKEHHIEIEFENELGFLISPTLEKEFEEKTGYNLREYQLKLVEEEKAAYLTLEDLKANQLQWKKAKGK